VLFEPLDSLPLAVAFRIIWCSVSELIGVMPGMRELSGVAEADRGLLQANDLHLVSNKAVEAAQDTL
jgi:hypothetical protein